MRKNISIDELFREGLSEGREQLNLGAWANMERLLDGKQPYALPEEEKRKRRIIPFFWLLFIAIIGTTGTLFVKHKMSGKRYTHPALSSNVSDGIKQSEHLTPQQITTDLSNQQVVSEMTATNMASTSKENSSTTSSSVNQSSSNEPVEQNMVNSTASVHTANPPARNMNTVPSIDRDKHSQASVDINPSTNSNSSNQNALSTLTVQQPKSNEKVSTQRSESIADRSSQNSIHPKEEMVKSKATVSSPLTDTLEQITRVERVTGSRQGKLERSLDTINTSQQVVTRAESGNTIDYHQSNPRYVDLDETQQALKTDQLEAVPVVKAEVKSTQEMAKSDSKNKTSEHSSWKESLENTRIKLGNALNTVSIKKILAYPGITAGVNAALFTASHNYGGFHAGVSNLTPINDHLAFLTEIRFFYRSNSGYSIQDIQSSMKGFSKDTVSLYNQQQTIYTYDMDSSVRRYNFKHMYSIEMPLSMQYNLNRLSFYGGVNLAYNTRLNTTVVSSNPVAHHYDTLSNNATFMAPAPSNYKYVNDDFKSRFGIGYMVGASYAFSPNVYLDLRATQTQWDNSKTVTSRAVSSSVFKIPYIQFSFGYRFKKYTPGGN